MQQQQQQQQQQQHSHVCYFKWNYDNNASYVQITYMTLLRRCVIAAVAWPPGLSQVQRSLSGRCLSVGHPIFRAQNKRPATALASFATRIVPYNVSERKFSAATGSNSGTEAPNGSSSSEGAYNDDATVKTVTSGRWKWVGMLAIGLGATIALSYDELERGEWQAGEAFWAHATFVI